MNARTQRRREAIQRADRFGDENPLTPPNAKATALFVELKTHVASTDLHSSAADLARGSRRGAVIDRKRAADTLRDALRELAKAAKSLDADQHPGVAAEMRLTGIETYPVLLDRGRTFLDVVEPIKPAFVELGFPADFDVQLQALIDNLNAANQRKFDGSANQVGGNAGLKTAVERGVRTMRKLDAILSKLLKPDAAKFAAWKSAIRISRDPQSAPAPNSGASTTPPAPAAP
jgi:hypothetical protein